MSPARLVKCDLLDPRPESEAAGQPIAGAVNIPFAELPSRSHELPPRSACIRVAGPAGLAASVVSWLTQHGRTAEIAAVQPEGGAIGSRSPAEAGPGEISRLWEPSRFLEEVAAHLRPGSAADLACGSGRNAVFLACCGWNVTAVDVLPDALVLGQGLERRYARGWHPIRWVCADLDAGETPVRQLQPQPQPGHWPDTARTPVPQHSAKQCGWHGPGGGFDLITMFRYLNRRLLTRLVERLSPGGSVVLETFTTLHRQRHGRPAREAHVLQPGELKELLRPLFSSMLVRHYSEAWRGQEHTARLWAEFNTHVL